LVVEDRLEGGAHECRLAFHLGPDIACTLERDRAILRWRDAHGERRATVALPDELTWERLEGQIDPPAGWYSPAFGARMPTVMLLGIGSVGTGRVLTTILHVDRRSTP
jgi:hypothetical protein